MNQDTKTIWKSLTTVNERNYWSCF